MAVFTVYGASDDLVEAEGVPGADEFNAVSRHWVGLLVSPDDERMLVYVDYRRNGCWTTTVGRWEEDVALPDWDIKISSDDDLCRYSTYMEITVPEGTTLTEVSPKDY